jgi:hypothetical protein
MEKRMFQEEKVRVNENDLFCMDVNGRSSSTMLGTGMSLIGHRKGKTKRIWLEDVTELAME